MFHESWETGQVMRVFISWSGDQSRQVADALREWLGDVIQGLQPWTSTRDIEPGASWFTSLGAALDASIAGILCLTPSNLSEPWVLFEAGALARSLGGRKLIPYLFGLEPAGLRPPVSLFQGVTASRDGTRSLVAAINSCSPQPLPAERLERAFERLWPDLERMLHDVQQASVSLGNDALSTVVCPTQPIGLLRVESGFDTGRVFVITDACRQISIGRLPENSVSMPVPHLSARHLRIDIRPVQGTSGRGFDFLVCDLGSSNGTFLNGRGLRPDSPATLASGDVLEFGPLKMRFQTTAG